jgi:hypothetical protein
MIVSVRFLDMFGAWDSLLLTVRFNLTSLTFDDFAKRWPFGEVFEVEADVVSFCEVVEVAWIETQQVHGRHGPYERHDGYVVCRLYLIARNKNKKNVVS